MSLRTVAYVNGKPIRIDEGPGHAGSPSRHGELIRGGPGAYEQAQIRARIRTQRDADLRREARK